LIGFILQPCKLIADLAKFACAYIPFEYESFCYKRLNMRGDLIINAHQQGENQYYDT